MEMHSIWVQTAPNQQDTSSQWSRCRGNWNPSKSGRWQAQVVFQTGCSRVRRHFECTFMCCVQQQSPRWTRFRDVEVCKCLPCTQSSSTVHTWEARETYFINICPLKMFGKVCHWPDHGILHFCHRPAPWLCLWYSSTLHALIELIHHWQNNIRRPWENGQGFNDWVLQSLRQSGSFYSAEEAGLCRTAQLPDEVADFILVSTTVEGQDRPTHIKAGVPQGTLCGPVGFLVHINDLYTGCSTLIYVDDCSIWEVCADDCHDPAGSKWGRWVVVQLCYHENQSHKTKEMTITFSIKRPTSQPVSINGTEIERTVRHLQTTRCHVIIRSELKPACELSCGKCAPCFTCYKSSEESWCRSWRPFEGLHFYDPVSAWVCLCCVAYFTDHRSVG